MAERCLAAAYGVVGENRWSSTLVERSTIRWGDHNPTLLLVDELESGWNMCSIVSK